MLLALCIVCLPLDAGRKGKRRRRHEPQPPKFELFLEPDGIYKLPEHLRATAHYFTDILNKQANNSDYSIPYDAYALEPKGMPTFLRSMARWTEALLEQQRTMKAKLQVAQGQACFGQCLTGAVLVLAFLATIVWRLDPVTPWTCTPFTQ